MQKRERERETFFIINRIWEHLFCSLVKDVSESEGVSERKREMANLLGASD